MVKLTYSSNANKFNTKLLRTEVIAMDITLHIGI